MLLEASRARPAASRSQLDDSDFASINDYVGKSEQTKLAAAAKVLEAIGPVASIRFCADDGASKVVLVMATARQGIHIGVLAVRIDT